MPTWTEATMIQWLTTCDKQKLIKPLEKLWERQTTAEQAAVTTRNRNGRGYCQLDVRFAKSLIDWFHRHNDFSDPQATAARTMLRKYRRQLCEIANSLPTQV
jgi:hypothetical protein